MILVSAAAACGAGKASGPAQPTQPTGAGPQTSGTEPQAGTTTTTHTTEQQPAAEDRCKKLIEHLVTLAVAERPAEQRISDDERKNIESQLRTSWGPKCNAMTERGYSCAVSAPTLAELDRCGG